MLIFYFFNNTIKRCGLLEDCFYQTNFGADSFYRVEQTEFCSWKILSFSFVFYVRKKDNSYEKPCSRCEHEDKEEFICERDVF